VIDSRLRPRLAYEPERHVRIGALDQLDRDRAIEPAIARLVHDAHAALAEQLAELVAIPLRRHDRPGHDRHILLGR
jgi:hypothetical protein